MQCVTADRRENGWFLHANSLTTTQLWQAVPPYIKLAPDVPADELGKTVVKLLAESSEGLPHPTDWDVPYPSVKLAGAKSWSKYARGTSHILVFADEEQLTFEPSAYEGGRGGFQYQPDLKFRISRSAGVDEIGLALVKAYSLCR
jgi:hypothetical protein